MVQINYIEIYPDGIPSPHCAVTINAHLVLRYNGGGISSIQCVEQTKRSLEAYHDVTAVYHHIEVENDWTWDAVLNRLHDNDSLTNPHHSEPLHCPQCRSDNIDGGKLETDCNTAWRTATCAACGHDWHENFRFDSWDDEYERESECDA